MRKTEWMVVLAVVLALGLATPSLAADLALVDVSAAAVRWDPQGGDFEKVVLTVSLPNGNVIRREIKAGQAIVFELDAAAKDGVYTYELRGIPHLDASVRKELAAARKAGNESAVIERLREVGKLPAEAVQSGAFTVHQGSVVSPDLTEPRQRAAASGNPQVITAADQVIPDDLIVQGSLCVGLDCVNNENFGFDTIRLKENNLRIHFDDTSTQAGFPANDWRLIANDSASGGSSKFSIEDSTSAKTPFTITAGAATNSIFVDSTGRLGLRTSTPVLDLHINTSNTPAIRLEQNNSGGFTAQTWDIGANEANFFVRDVTGGSKLSLRIRPGAPTSSLDISSDGDVGIGTGSPENQLHVVCAGAGETCAKMENSSATGFSGFEFTTAAGATVANIAHDNSAGTFRFNAISNVPIVIMTNSTERIRFPAPGGNIITAAAGAVLNSLGQWVDGSSRNLKQDIADLSSPRAFETLRRLNPVTYAYKAAPDEVQAGFIAEDVPELVAQKDRKGLSSLEIVAVLTKVVQDQQKTIDELNTRLAELEKQKD